MLQVKLVTRIPRLRSAEVQLQFENFDISGHVIIYVATASFKSNVFVSFLIRSNHFN